MIFIVTALLAGEEKRTFLLLKIYCFVGGGRKAPSKSMEMGMQCFINNKWCAYPGFCFLPLRVVIVVEGCPQPRMTFLCGQRGRARIKFWEEAIGSKVIRVNN